MSVTQVKESFNTAIEYIDSKTHRGYAMEHPELVGAWLQAAAIYDAGARISGFLGRSDSVTVSEALHNLSENAEYIGTSLLDLTRAVEAHK